MTRPNRAWSIVCAGFSDFVRSGPILRRKRVGMVMVLGGARCTVGNRDGMAFSYQGADNPARSS